MVRRRHPEPPPQPRGRRASWTGPLRFGLVSFEVQAVNASPESGRGIHFHLLHAPDHQRIHYAKVCPTHGEVPNDEIVQGYEVSKGKYVEFAKDELTELRGELDRALSIEAFVPPEAVDPLYFDGRTYYLLPADNHGNEPYALLSRAMSRRQRWGLSKIVFSGREQLALVHPVGDTLVLSLLRYEADVLKPGDVENNVPRVRAEIRKQKLAEQLIQSWEVTKPDLSQYSDQYESKVRHAIEAKRRGKTVLAEEPEPAPRVINLIDALKQSLGRRGVVPAKQTKKAVGKKGPARKRRTG